MSEPILLPGRTKDLTGQKFNRLTVLSYAGSEKNRAMWNCRCECGKEIAASGTGIRAGDPKSCGCARVDACIVRSTKHGFLKTHKAEYHAWKNMADRCTNPDAANYSEYGGRGIRVCERWLGESGLANFIADMGKRPSPQHSIDRKDNSKGYAPENCRWATDSEQQWNKRDTHLVTFGGLTLPVRVWAKRIGIPHSTLRGRLKKWPLERALTEPVQVQSG